MWNSLGALIRCVFFPTSDHQPRMHTVDHSVGLLLDISNQSQPVDMELLSLCWQRKVLVHAYYRHSPRSLSIIYHNAPQYMSVAYPYSPIPTPYPYLPLPILSTFPSHVCHLPIVFSVSSNHIIHLYFIQIVYACYVSSTHTTYNPPYYI